MLPAISIIDGTWRGETPYEMLVFVMCRELHITPRQFMGEFSAYEQRYFWDFLQEVWQHEKDEVETAKRKANK